MHLHFATKSGHLWNSLAETLRLNGFDPGEFEIRHEAEAAVLGDAMSDSVFRLRRLSTGNEQLYSVAPGSPWLFSAHADLAAGRFGVPQAQ
ncbi:hypothetical protein [Roseateles sp.]|jgi:hypothetical protein|uniref:hypothetical protein n=1 Tax=Roseateles sp. TaxID=1971397 RepID=UPI003919A2F0